MPSPGGTTPERGRRDKRQYEERSFDRRRNAKRRRASREVSFNRGRHFSSGSSSSCCSFRSRKNRYSRSRSPINRHRSRRHSNERSSRRYREPGLFSNSKNDRCPRETTFSRKDRSVRCPREATDPSRFQPDRIPRETTGNSKNRSDRFHRDTRASSYSYSSSSGRSFSRSSYSQESHVSKDFPKDSVQEEPEWKDQLEEDVQLSDSVLKQLCVASTLKIYINKTDSLRGNVDDLFVSIKSPYKASSPQTLARWLRMTLEKSGIDTTMFRAHSTRHASTSAAGRKGIDINLIRQTAGWSEKSAVFAKFYSKPLIDKTAFAKAIMSKKTSVSNT